MSLCCTPANISGPSRLLLYINRDQPEGADPWDIPFGPPGGSEQSMQATQDLPSRSLSEPDTAAISSCCGRVQTVPDHSTSNAYASASASSCSKHGHEHNMQGHGMPGYMAGFSHFSTPRDFVLSKESHLCSPRADSIPSKTVSANTRLLFTMMRVVLNELGERVSMEEALSETEISSIAELSSELQNISSKSHSVRVKPELASGVIEKENTDRQSIESGTLQSNLPTNLQPNMDLAPNEHREDWQTRLIDLFKKLDSDGSGSLSADELRRALNAAGIPSARLTKLLRCFETNRRGEIDLETWVRTVQASSEDKELQEIALLSRRLSAQQQSGALFAESVRNKTWILEPTSRRRIGWDCLILILCIYISIALPFLLAWEGLMNAETVRGFQIVEICIDCIFGIDIILNFNTGYYNKDSDLIMNRLKVMNHYLTGWFLLDFVSTFPFAELGLQAADNMQAFKLVKLGKLLRLVKLMSPRQTDMSDISEVLEDFSTSKIMQVVYRRSAICLNITFVCHWMACGMKMVDDGFLDLYQDVSGSISQEYLAALYWAMTTLTTVGYGDITPSSDGERGYTIISMVVGGGFYGYVVGSITSMVANSDLNATAYYERMDLIHAWLTHHKLPMPVKRRLRRYFKSYLSEKSAVNEADIWKDLSPELQRDVGEYIVHEDVKANPLFDGLNIGSVVRLQSILQRITVNTGRCVSTQGEAGTAMYIIVSGLLRLERQRDNEVIVSTLSPGQSFGEEILLGFVEHYEYTVTVVEKARLEMITEDEFLGLFQNMPNVLERMKQNAVYLHPQFKDI